MNFIKNLSIRNKLLLISISPLVALFYFLGTYISDEISNRNTIEIVYSDVVKAELLSNVIHQLQQERGYAMGYMLSEGKETKAELFAQYQQTDKAIQNFQQFTAAQDSNVYTSLRIKISELRNKIISSGATPDSIQNEFAEVLLSLVDEVNNTALYSKNPKVKSLLNAHISLIYAKEYFGELRSELKQTLMSGAFQGNGFAEFSSLKGKYELNLENFKKNTSAELATVYGREMANASVYKVNKIIDAAYHNQSLVSFPYSSDDWWANGVSFLNTLKIIEDHSLMAIRKTAEDQLEEISTSITRNILIALAIVLFTIFLLYYIIRTLVNSVIQIKQAADRITLGDLDLSVAVDSKDEIGSLASSFNQLIEVSKEYAKTAEKIGGGDYSADVKVRSTVDVLGLSLNNMKHNLQKLSEETATRTWLLKGNSELNDTIRGEKLLRELAQDIIIYLANYLKAQIGAIYLAENDVLNLYGSYAFHNRKGNSNSIKIGQGLVGQAALEKKPIIFSSIPDNYLKINSGLGSVEPKNIIVFPFLYDKQVRGVIEIGSAAEFSELDLQFLELVGENIGVAFNSSHSRTQLKELLEETQRQAEELEAQQEELRETNEELHMKTQLLEKSEAELKTQQEELQQTNEELEEKASLLEEQKDKLEVAKMEVETKARELEVTSKYKSEFLANMSHELRTPLNSMLILAELLSENKSKSMGEKEIDFARNICSSGNDLLNLINEILDLSKVESGKIELDISKVTIYELVENLESLFNEVAKNKSTEFEINFNKEEFKHPFATDKFRLEQILRNLLSNAFKFTSKGGRIALDVSIVQSIGNFKNKKLNGLDKVMAFSVRDTGIGIPENKQSVIFEAFQQADGSTKRRYGGTGLGLSISRELANALGGEIHLESSEGKGSTFTLYLPLEFDPTLIVPVEKEISVKEVVKTDYKYENLSLELGEEVSDDRYAIKDTDKVVLIIEDDSSFAHILLKFVRERGYLGILAHQGNTGLSLARHYRPDAIILDMKLPVMEGSEVLRNLKNDPNLRHIPVQIISGYDRRKEGFELGAFDFVKKPISQSDLNSSFGRIEEFINRKLKKLLIVEDNKQQNKAIQELIGNGDVKSFSAFTGEEAHNMLQKENFDCIIIDLGLPDMSGFDLMEKIKAAEKLKRIPVIVYTAKDLTKEESSRLNKLANTVVLKTVDSNERLLDETSLFLHRVESKLPLEKQQIIRKLHRTDEVLNNKKVLIVDDDIRNIYSLSNALEEEGLKCITAENGKEAIEILKEHSDTDVVLMDIMMPEMDGYESTQEIRKLKRFDKLPIIALTAKAMKGDREKCLKAGMSDYVSKPVNIQQLLSLLRVWLYK